MFNREKAPHHTEDDQSIYSNYCRAAVAHLDRYERYECQELLSFSSAHWLLSNEVFRGASIPLEGMASTISPKENTAVILFPVNSESPPLCYREIHTIVRELTLGIYVFSQTPYITLEANFDNATTCNIPPAYLDTRVGQLLTNVDYMLKGLWHGAYIPREKRVKFAEAWRDILDVNAVGIAETRKSLITEFQNAGLMDITNDPAYANAYDQLPEAIPDDRELSEEQAYFMSHVDNLSMQLTFFQEKVEYYQNMYIVNAQFHVSSIVRLLDNNLNNAGFERLKTRLQMHEILIEKHLAAKQETLRQLELLKLVSYLVPFFLGMRKRMKIPDVNKLLPPLSYEKCRTEREFPPLIVSPDFKCKIFKQTGQYFHLHGGISFDLETDPMVEASDKFIHQYRDVVTKAEKQLYNHKYLDSNEKDIYDIPIYSIDDKSYYAIVIEFETFYGILPHKPQWVRAFNDEMDKLKPIRLPISDIHMFEQLKKQFGYKKAIKCKTPAEGVKACAQRGMLSIFNALSRKVTSSGLGINRRDEKGLTLLHHAAMYNRPQIISRLLLNSVDVNACRNTAAKGSKKAASNPSNSSLHGVSSEQTANVIIGPSQGPTALHIAARCGSLEAVSCLLSNHANIMAVDQDGWAPVHHAAFFGHSVIVKLIIKKNAELLDLPTANELHSTPLLLAATSGVLAVVMCLIEHHAEITVKDLQDNNVVSLACLHYHTNILEYLTELDHPYVNVWNNLVEMLADDDMVKKDSSVKCLEILSISKPDHWKCILAAGAIPILVSLLDINNEEIRAITASVLCNMSDYEPVKLALSKVGAVPSLIKLLSSTVDDTQSRAAIILSDIAHIDNNQTVIAENGGIELLVALLESYMEDVLVNAVNAIRVLCLDHCDNQNTLAKCDGLRYLVEFLTLSSIDVQAAAAAALTAAVHKNQDNQNQVIQLKAAKPLVELIMYSRSVTVQLKVACTLEALANNNPSIQKCFLELDAPKALIRLLKNQHVEVREQGACALWSLAGNIRTQQRYIAERISVPHIVQMILEHSEKLLYVGCMVAVAYGTENMANQNKLVNADVFSQLVRLLRSPKTSQKILHMVVKVLGIMCLGVASRNNLVTQHKIAEEGGITILIKLLVAPPTKEIQVEVAITLACLTLSCKKNQELLAAEHQFSFQILLPLFKIKDPEIQLRAGMALTLFAFNNTAQQYNLREAGGLKYKHFKRFIDSSDEFYQCYGAFQTIVLARVIIDKDQVSLTAQGIEILVSKISCEDKVAILTCSLLASLTHMRAGLSDAMICVGVLDLLINKLSSANDMVVNAAAVTVGYLTFNRTAFRLLFSICRNTPALYNKIIDNIGQEPRINENFSIEFKKAIENGLPSQFAHVTSKRKLVHLSDSARLNRERSDVTGKRKLNKNINNRARSAPTHLVMPSSLVKMPNIVTEANNLQGKNREINREISSLRPVSTAASVSSKTKIKLDS